MISVDESVFPKNYIYPIDTGRQPVTPAPLFSPIGSIATTLTIASALSIGSNMVDVQNGGMTFPLAISGGLAKGAAATLILSVTTRSTVVQVMLAAGVLATAGYLIDSIMKKDLDELCVVPKRVG